MSDYWNSILEKHADENAIEARERRVIADDGDRECSACGRVAHKDSGILADVDGEWFCVNHNTDGCLPPGGGVAMGTKSIHTKGPWTVAPGTFTDLVLKSAERVRPIALLALSGDAEDEREDRANAAVLAAAPELLEALTKLIAQVDFDVDGATINLPDAGCLECTSGTTPNKFNTGPCGYHAALAAIAKAEGKS